MHEGDSLPVIGSDEDTEKVNEEKSVEETIEQGMAKANDNTSVHRFPVRP